MSWAAATTLRLSTMGIGSGVETPPAHTPPRSPQSPESL